MPRIFPLTTREGFLDLSADGRPTHQLFNLTLSAPCLCKSQGLLSCPKLIFLLIQRRSMFFCIKKKKASLNSLHKVFEIPTQFSRKNKNATFSSRERKHRFSCLYFCFAFFLNPLYFPLFLHRILSHINAHKIFSCRVPPLCNLFNLKPVLVESVII